MRQGGVRRQPGYRYIAEARYQGVGIVVRPFTFSVNSEPQVYVLEFGDGYIRFHNENGTVQSGGFPYQVATPYAWQDVAGLQMKQIGDTVRIAHVTYGARG